MNNHHLVLGGTGFVGRHVALSLARAGCDVTIASRNAPEFQFPQDVAGRINWRRYDRSTADWNALVAESSVVHDYAWSSVPASANADPEKDLSENLGPMFKLLDALHRKGKMRLIFASSGGTVYGRVTKSPVHEGHFLAPVTAYGASKATTEIYMGLYRAMHGLDVRIARISNVYGAGQNLASGVGAISIFLQKALKNQQIVIWGNGETIRDYVHIDDVAACLTLIALADEMPSAFTFNVGSGIGTSLNQIVAAIECALDHSLDIRYETARNFDVPVSVLDTSLARACFGWTAKVSVDTGILQTLIALRSERRF